MNEGKLGGKDGKMADGTVIAKRESEGGGGNRQAKRVFHVEQDGKRGEFQDSAGAWALSQTERMATSAGVTPGTRRAWPRSQGRIRDSFSRVS